MTRSVSFDQARILAVIPARFGSSRLPGKPLAPIAGRPLIEHVWRRVIAAQRPQAVVVATDDERIVAAIEACGGVAVMTRKDHASGSDRIAEVAAATRAEIIVNIQGDEPEIAPALIDELVDRLDGDAGVSVATAASPFPEELDPADPAAVKVVLDRRKRALYFSRAAIPFVRDPDGAQLPLLHLGIYAFRRQALEAFPLWKRGPLERAESLEQLRFLENGHSIGVVLTDAAAAGIDTPEDLRRFSDKIETRGAQQDESAAGREPSWPDTSS